MNRSKKIFLIFAGIFLIVLLIFSIDVSRRTTFPGQQKDKIQSDSSDAETDSLENEMK